MIRKSEEAGLVHLVDNAREGIKHTCNCCGCCCWSVGTIRRKKIPRDVLMATYFIRETDRERCTGCGQCVEICPVQVIRMEGDFPVVDREWCIGCGVCAIPCPAAAVKLVRRTHAIPPRDFRELHEQILKERNFRTMKPRFFVASFLRMTESEPQNDKIRGSQNNNLCFIVILSILLGFVTSPFFCPGLQAALPGRTFSLPRDRFSHPDFKTESWYYSGHLHPDTTKGLLAFSSPSSGPGLKREQRTEIEMVDSKPLFCPSCADG